MFGQDLGENKSSKSSIALNNARFHAEIRSPFLSNQTTHTSFSLKINVEVVLRTQDCLSNRFFFVDF